MHTQQLTFSSNSNEPDSLTTNEFQGLVNIADPVDTELSFLFSWRQFLTRDNLKQSQKGETIPQVVLNALYLYAYFSQM